MRKIELREVKRGEYFRFTGNGPVWVRGYYERTERKYEVYKYDDTNHELFCKGTREVFVDFEF